MGTGLTQTTFKFDTKTEERLTRLKSHYGATSKAEIVRKAIALLDRVREIEAAGADLAAIERDSSSGTSKTTLVSLI